MPVLDQGGDYGFTDLMKAQALDEGVSVDDEDWCSVDSLQQRHRKNPSSVVDSDFVSNADELDPEPETDFPPRRPSLSNDSLVPNPFVNEILIGSWPEAIKITLMTIFVLPIRLIGIIFFFLLTWVLARVGVCGMLESDLRDHPISGWRKRVRETACFSMRLLFLFGGFHWVSVKGKQANSKEAPIVVVAPHSSFFDALPVIMMGAPGLVAKGDIEKTSLLSALLNFTQPVYVWREDPNSRQNTIKEIQRRMESKEDWPQMLLFPEGTCTNRSALITFKPGAFYPGLPVQPVCLRYEADQDLTSWTWKGASWMEVLWRTLARPHTPCEMEFLPVYYPNDAEKADPVLYAKNVRQVMAELLNFLCPNVESSAGRGTHDVIHPENLKNSYVKVLKIYKANALSIPTADYTFEDCRAMSAAEKYGLPCNVGLVQVFKLSKSLGMTTEDVLAEIKRFAAFADKETGLLNLEKYAAVVGLSLSPSEMFSLLSLDLVEEPLTFREYVLHRKEISELENIDRKLRSTFEALTQTKEDVVFDRSAFVEVNADRGFESFKEQVLSNPMLLSVVRVGTKDQSSGDHL